MTAGLYIGEGSENRSFWIFNLFPRPTGLKPGSQIWKGLFSDPSPIQKFLFLKVLIFLTYILKIMFLQKRTSSLSMRRFHIKGLSYVKILEAGRTPSAYQPVRSQT
jgi:hypothetical protein